MIVWENPMNKDSIERCLKTHREQLEQRFDVRALYLFGSVAREEATQESDVMCLLTSSPPQRSTGSWDCCFFWKRPCKPESNW